jgi:2-polyprenyl-6-methoxyphenol hydroxylase-like FAD-dependent oxidoreductase
MATRVHEIDVAIVGAGPAGCAVALALDPGLSCMVVDPLGAGSVGIGETLPPGVQPLLERLGMWSAFLEQQHMPVHGTAACWGSAQIENHPFLFHPFGSGWHLDRARFDALLRSRVPIVHGRGLELADSTKLRPRFVVDATGRTMAIARARGAECVAWDRTIARFARYSARFARYSRSNIVDTTTLIEAVRDGWWYSAVVPSGDLIVAAFCDPEQPPALGPKTARRIAGAEPVQQWQCSARAQAATQVHGDDWLAIGDAALAADPLSSQGIAQALAMGIAAGEAISRHLDGDSRGLARYAESIASLRRQFLIARRDTYRREHRFADAPFWRCRRHDITLAPTARLQHVQPLRAAHALHLPRRELDLLAQTCTGRQAHEVVRAFQRFHPRNDMVVLLALQGLHDAGVVHSA